VTGEHCKQSRLAAGVKVEEIATLLGQPAGVVEVWESRTSTLPGGILRRYQWALAVAGREALLRASGLPACEWVENRTARMEGMDLKSIEAMARELDAHAAGCGTCQARRAFEQNLPPLPDPPHPWHFKLLGTIALQVQRLPGWLRPAAAGALLLGALTVLRAAVSVILGGTPLSLALVGTVLLAMLAAGYAGAVGGIAYALAAPRLRRAGRAGPYLMGLVCMFAYLVALGIPGAIATGATGVLLDPAAWVAGLLMGGGFGLAIGHWMFKPLWGDA